MKTALFYGLVLALANIVLALVSFFLGYQTDNIAAGQWFSLLGLAVAVGIMWAGIRAVREEAKDRSLPFGRGVLAGTVISASSGAIYSVYTFIHFQFINPSFLDYYIDFLRGKWAAKGLREAQMATMEKITRFMMSPGIMSIVTFLYAMIIGVVLALILAAILRRAPAKESPAAMPPPQPAA